MPVIEQVVILVMDSAGVGALPDAHLYGDEGSNTLGNLSRAVGGLSLPTLGSLGLGSIIPIAGVPPSATPLACYGKMAEQSPGKDTTTGHWEIAGI
ncbi:MAG: phosphopentomutase, partial [Bacillota bacterium]